MIRADHPPLILSGGIPPSHRQQAGDWAAAAEQFKAIAVMAVAVPSPELDAVLEMNSGFLAMAKNDYEMAEAHFRQVLQYGDNLAAACNVGVCLLYRGSLSKAIAYYEGLTRPDRHASDTVVLNLNTLYEIETNNSLKKKSNAV